MSCLSALVAENMFFGTGRLPILVGGEMILPRAGLRWGDVTWGSLVLTEVHGVLEGFVVDKEELSLEIAGPILNKANDPFLRLRKKIGP